MDSCDSYTIFRSPQNAERLHCGTYRNCRTLRRRSTSMSAKHIDTSRIYFDTFASRVIRIENGCWQWQGTLRNGYAIITEKGARTLKRRQIRAHRYAFLVFRHEIPDGLDLDHLCRNRACVNPFHLQPVTRKVNLYRGDTLTIRNKYVTHCPRGHEYTENNTYIDKTGGRRCRACARMRTYAIFKGLPPPSPATVVNGSWVVPSEHKVSPWQEQ